MKNRRSKPVTSPHPGNGARFDGQEGHAFREEKGWAIAIVGFSICLILFLWPMISGREEPRWDAFRQFYPSFTYQADAYAEWRFPLWDPYTNCGYPFHAEPQNSTLSPLAIAAGALFHDSGRGFVMYYMVLWWIAGAGTIWTAKALGIHPIGGFIAALTYAFSGFFVAHAQHTPYICVAAWLPWVFGLATKSVAVSNWGYALLSGAALGLSSLGGYPILVFFTGFALTLWLPLWFLPGTEREDHERTRISLLKTIVGTLCIVGAVAVLVWSPVLHAFFTEGSGYTDRVASLASGKANYGGPLTLPALITLMFPYMSILRPDYLAADGADMSMSNVYLGALCIPLAAYWYLRADERKRWGFLLFVALMFLTSLGGKAGVRTFLYHLLPPMRFIRFSSPFRLYWIFPMAIAAGFGFSRLIRHTEEIGAVLKIAFGWLVVGTGVVLLYLLLLVIRLGFHGISHDHFPGRLLLPMVLALPAFIVVLWIWKIPIASTHSRIPLVLMLAVFAGDFWGHVENNNYTVWGMEPDSIRKAEAFHKRESTLMGEPGGRLPPHPPPPPWNMNAQQVNKIPVVAGYVTMVSRGFDDILCRSSFVEVLMSPVRFWLSSGAELSPPEGMALEVLSNVGSGVPVPVFVSDVRNVHDGITTVPGTFGKVGIRLYSPERVILDVYVPGTRNAVLASTERYTAGWKAHVDGTLVNVFRVNLYFRGILVPPGEHVVTWQYDPNLWRPLVWLSGVTLLTSIGGGIFLSTRRARNLHSNADG